MSPSVPIRACKITDPCTFICRASMGYDGSTGRSSTWAVSADILTLWEALTAGAEAGALAGAPMAMSTFTEFVPGRTDRRSAPANPPLFHGGKGRRLVREC